MTRRFVVRQADTFKTYVGKVVSWGPKMVTVYTAVPDAHGHYLVRFPTDAIVQQDSIAA